MNNERRTSEPASRPARDRKTRRPYLQPALVEYGPVAKLTQMGAGSVTDGMGGLQSYMAMCL
jgi:hypothetical protein